MPGIYVAKPAVASVPDVPEGWDLDWPFCGVSGYDPDPFFPAPYPPGYTPTLTLVMTADDELAFDGTATVTGSARDNATYATNEPSAITWTAAIDGAPVNLRFNGDSSYSSSLSSAVSFGTYWGATPSIEFELTEDNADDVVTLTGSYVLDEVWIENSEDITITAVTTILITAHYELVGSIGAGYYYGQTRIRIAGISMGSWLGAASWYWPDQNGWYNVSATPEDEVTVETDAGSVAGGTATTTVLTLREGETYEVRADVNFSDCTAKVTLTITIGEDEYVYVDDVDGFADQVIVEIDADTLEVTQTNP